MKIYLIKILNILKRKSIKTQKYDLHGYSLEEANNKVKSLINESLKKVSDKLIIITGKGLHSENEKILMFQKILVY